MKMICINICAVLLALFTSCEKENLNYFSGDMEIRIESGENWLHDYPLFLGLSKKNPPQFAIWAEDTDGNYLTTIYATYKIATEGWKSNKGNRRKEALPYWCYSRGVVYDDGLMLPTKEKPLEDGITGATPKSDKTVQLRLSGHSGPVVIKAEFNHSLDFNDVYPKDAQNGDSCYSGGKEGSGQPAVIYSVTVYPDTEYAELELIGHSSPDGSNGKVYRDISGLTSALGIVKRITVTVK